MYDVKWPVLSCAVMKLSSTQHVWSEMCCDIYTMGHKNTPKFFSS